MLWLTRWPRAGKIGGSVFSGLILLTALTGGASEPNASTAQQPVTETVEASEQTPTIAASANAAPPSAYEQALSSATTAVDALATAETSADWDNIARRWSAAIDSLAEIPLNSDYATQAQAKSEEYQRNYDYAIEQEATIQSTEAEAIAAQTKAEEEAIAEQRRLEEAESAYAAVPATPANSGYVAGTCKDLKAQGIGSNFTPGDPNYSSSRDRDNDGVACES
ncbi:MAG: excalibur calcium-binding domain-containing protein [Phormidesmis sp.]